MLRGPSLPLPLPDLLTMFLVACLAPEWHLSLKCPQELKAASCQPPDKSWAHVLQEINPFPTTSQVFPASFAVYALPPLCLLTGAKLVAPEEFGKGVQPFFLSNLRMACHHPALVSVDSRNMLGIWQSPVRLQVKMQPQVPSRSLIM